MDAIIEEASAEHLQRLESRAKAFTEEWIRRVKEFRIGKLTRREYYEAMRACEDSRKTFENLSELKMFERILATKKHRLTAAGEIRYRELAKEFRN
jgi:hypothetical protein